MHPAQIGASHLDEELREASLISAKNQETQVMLS